MDANSWVIVPAVWATGFTAGYLLRSWVSSLRRRRARRSRFQIQDSGRTHILATDPDADPSVVPQAGPVEVEGVEALERQLVLPSGKISHASSLSGKAEVGDVRAPAQWPPARKRSRSQKRPLT
jgi:hypothetical protein